ncbi:hypothetical protein [Aeromonas sp. s3]|uniref:trypsin-like peptidase domain-containing protein n=1 Tax=Aeromonas sp. s3 TaxID=3138485 RepID=UPI0034A4038B
MEVSEFSNFKKQFIINDSMMGTIEILTFKSLFIEMYFDEHKLSSGTAFLAANDRESHCALITNRHNVTGRNQETGECLSNMCATPNNIVIHFHKNNSVGEWLKVKLPLYRDDETPFWIEDPILGAKADVVALNLNWGRDVSKVPFYIKTNLDRDDLYVGPGDTVSVIGFPFGVSSFGKFPIWATGFLAQELLLMTDDNPVFLIDCRARQGQSGSPVVAYRAGGYRQYRDGTISSVMSATPKWEFLGIYSGRVNNESDLGRVWHVSIIDRVLNAAEEDYQKRKNNNKNAS